MRYSGCQSVEHDEAKHPYKVALGHAQKKQSEGIKSKQKRKGPVKYSATQVYKVH